MSHKLIEKNNQKIINEHYKLCRLVEEDRQKIINERHKLNLMIQKHEREMQFKMKLTNENNNKTENVNALHRVMAQKHEVACKVEPTDEDHSDGLVIIGRFDSDDYECESQSDGIDFDINAHFRNPFAMSYNEDE